MFSMSLQTVATEAIKKAINTRKANKEHTRFNEVHYQFDSYILKAGENDSSL